MLCCLHKSFYKKCPKNQVFAKHKKNNDIKNVWIKSYAMYVLEAFITF